MSDNRNEDIRKNIRQAELDAEDECTECEHEVENKINCILAAHKREIAERDGERKGILKANEQFAADNTRLRGEIVAKDKEIARLISIINTECNKCGGCAKFGSDCSAGDVDGNEDCRACSRFVSKEIAEKDAEIERLRIVLRDIVLSTSPKGFSKAERVIRRKALGALGFERVCDMTDALGGEPNRKTASIG